MKQLFSFALLLFSFSTCVGQTSKLHISFYPVQEAGTSTLNLLLDSTIIHTQVMDKMDYIQLDKLSAGSYVIEVRNEETKENYYYRKALIIEPDQEYHIYINLEFDKNQWPIHSSDTTATHSEFQLSMNYNNKALYDIAPFRSHFTLSEDGFTWLPIGKHIGQLVGGGVSFSRYLFDKDSTFESEINPVLKRKYYSLDFSFKYLIRFSQRNQRTLDEPIGFFLDLGAEYNLPAFFRENFKYKNDIHTVQARIHNYNDFRLIAQAGYYPFAFTCEYRINDFVKRNQPQLPRLEFGLKLFIAGE